MRTPVPSETMPAMGWSAGASQPTRNFTLAYIPRGVPAMKLPANPRFTSPGAGRSPYLAAFLAKAGPETLFVLRHSATMAEWRTGESFAWARARRGLRSTSNRGRRAVDDRAHCQRTLARACKQWIEPSSEIEPVTDGDDAVRVSTACPSPRAGQATLSLFLRRSAVCSPARASRELEDACGGAIRRHVSVAGL